MKNFNKYNVLVVLVILLTLASCEKDEISEEDVVLNAKDVAPIEGLIPDAVGKTYKFGKTIEEVNLASANRRVKKLFTNDSWRMLTKDKIFQAGYKTNDAIFTAFTNKYNAVNGTRYNKITTMSIGKDNQRQVYAYSWQLGNAHASRGYNPPYFKYVGEGTVSQNTGFAPWTPVPGYNARVERNYTNKPKNLGGTLWFSNATTTSKQVTVEVSGSIKVIASVKIPFVADGGTEVTLGQNNAVTIGKEKTFTENFYYPHFVIPPGKSVRYQLEQRWVPVTTTWKLPIQLTGQFGTNFGYSGPPQHGGQIIGFKSLNASVFNSDFAQPGRYQTLTVSERLSHEFRIAAYIM